MPRRPLALLVDDNDRFRDRIERELGSEGFDVLAAASGDAALEIVRDIRPDVVVSDLEMPGLDGLHFCRMLRELRAFDAVPLILCTHAEAYDDRVREARLLVGVTVVHKPIDGYELGAVLEDLLGVGAETMALRGVPAGPALAPAGLDHASGLLARTQSVN